MHRKRDRVLRPSGRAIDVALLHVVELRRGAVLVLAHPQSGKARNVLRLQKSAPLNHAARKIHWQRLRQRRKRPVTLRFRLNSHRVLA